MKSGKLGMGGLREAVGAGLPTRNDQKALYFLAKRGGQGKTVYPAHPFFAATAAGFGHLEDFRYHEVERAKMEKQRGGGGFTKKVEKQGFRTVQLRGPHVLFKA